jgi:hypothetical protein
VLGKEGLDSFPLLVGQLLARHPASPAGKPPFIPYVL